MIYDNVCKIENKRTYKFPKGNCVYLLYKGREVVYVGSSANSKSRIQTHFHSDKDFDGFDVIPVPHDSSMYEAESILMVKYNPKYNNDLPNGGIYILASRVVSKIEDRAKDAMNDFPIAFCRGKKSYVSINESERIIDAMFKACSDELSKIIEESESE